MNIAGLRGKRFLQLMTSWIISLLYIKLKLEWLRFPELLTFDWIALSCAAWWPAGGMTSSGSSSFTDSSLSSRRTNSDDPSLSPLPSFKQAPQWSELAALVVPAGSAAALSRPPPAFAILKPWHWSQHTRGHLWTSSPPELGDVFTDPFTTESAPWSAPWHQWRWRGRGRGCWEVLAGLLSPDWGHQSWMNMSHWWDWRGPVDHLVCTCPPSTRTYS